MADERIIELDAVTDVPADAYLVIDSPTQGTKKILPIKIGATYTIQDGDHSFTLVGSNGYSHTVDIPYDSVSMTQAEYNALTPAQKADGTARFLTDAESDVESELWSKVGRQTLDTEAQVLSNAINELNSRSSGIDYSTEEREVGTWIDGSKIYERTWNFSSSLSISGGSWGDTSIAVADTNINIIVDCEAVSSSGARWSFISATTDLATTTYVRLLNVRSADVNVKYLTLRYTKVVS